MNSTQEKQHWDIFCRVIDNYGDIGVCWRLARQLANEYPFQVRLWVDDLAPLLQICPTARNTRQQFLDNIEVCAWQDAFSAEVIPADVVIEAFACNLPDSYLQAIKTKASATHWFNLEYLSAEDWVEGCHGLQSIHPQLGLKKIFFFPGVTAKTGGLLKEKQLLDMRDSFLSNSTQQHEFMARLGVQRQPESLLVSLFAYENSAVGSLLDSWTSSKQKILCLVPASKILPSIGEALGQSLEIGDEYFNGSLQLNVIPFLSQIEYDQLLWLCDVNFIRGEDSFVRAQWAAKPFIWHIYPQDDDVHMEKLNAFLKRYLEGLDSDSARAITQLWQNWNQNKNCAAPWNICLDNRQIWQQHSKEWCQHLNSLGDLASNMVHFCQKTL